MRGPSQDVYLLGFSLERSSWSSLKEPPQQFCPWPVSIPRPLDLVVTIVPMILTPSNCTISCASPMLISTFINAPFINKPSWNYQKLKYHLCSLWNFTNKIGKTITLTLTVISDIFIFVSTVLLGVCHCLLSLLSTFCFYKLGVLLPPPFFYSTYPSYFWGN